MARQSGIAVGLKSIAAHILSKLTPLGHPVPNIRRPGLRRKFAAGAGPLHRRKAAHRADAKGRVRTMRRLDMSIR
ncbi:hypothetical protein J4G37_17520 [Microvirga sp. 3-52]|nr:hypothetical protein [Microvirga sp. 3-52]